MSNKEPIFRPGLLVLSIDQCGTNSIIGTYAKFPKKELVWLRENFGKHFEASNKNAIIASTVTP